MLYQEVRSTSYIFALAITASLFNLFFQIIATRLLTSSEFAQFVSIVAVVTLVQYSVSGIENGLVSEVARAFTSKSGLGLSNIRRRWGKALVAMTLLSLILVWPISFFTKINIVNTLLSLVVVVGILYSILPKGFLMGVQLIDHNYKAMLTESFARVLLFLVLALFISGAKAALLAWIVSIGIFIVISRLYISRFYEHKPDAEEAELDLRSDVVVTNTISLTLFYTVFNLDVILADISYRAEYGALALIGKLIFFGGVLFVPIMYSRVAAFQERASARRLVALVFGYISVAMMGFFGVVYLFGEFFVEIIVGDEYSSVTRYLPFYGLGMFVFVYAFVALNYYLARRKRFNYILFAIPLIQLMLFFIQNSTVSDAVQNQLIAWGSFAFAVLMGFVYDRIRASKESVISFS